jgi:CRP/FNR family transcriptional regulator, cyclic AMP receptor protein
MALCIVTMPKILQSQIHLENTGRSVGAPTVFDSLPKNVQAELRRGAIRRSFTDGQMIWHRGDVAEGFWIIEKGQVKVGHHAASGEMQALFILGPGDSFGELACLGEFPRVVDADAMGDTQMLWINASVMSAEIAGSPKVSRAFIKALSQQLQEAIDRLIVFRNLSAPKRLAQNLLALCEGRPMPVKLGIRQQELAELVGVSRMTIASALAQLEELGLVSRHYRHLMITDPAALRRWMKA